MRFQCWQKQKVCQKHNIVCLNETWLYKHSVSRFPAIQADREHKQSGKCLLHFAHVTVNQRLCTPDTELLAVLFRSYYPLTEFNCVVKALWLVPRLERRYTHMFLLLCYFSNDGISCCYLHMTSSAQLLEIYKINTCLSTSCTSNRFLFICYFHKVAISFLLLVFNKVALIQFPSNICCIWGFVYTDWKCAVVCPCLFRKIWLGALDGTGWLAEDWGRLPADGLRRRKKEQIKGGKDRRVSQTSVCVLWLYGVARLMYHKKIS